MKYRTTDREQRENNRIVLGFCYCEIQNIERYLNANAYTCGLYGWKADFYHFDNFTISTGYHPLRFIYKTRDFKDMDKCLSIEAEYLTKYIEKLEKKLNNKKIKLPLSWQQAHKKVVAMIEKASERAAKKAAKQVYKN